MGTALQGGLKQAPEGSRHHDARRETGQRFLYAGGDLFFQEEDHGRSQDGAQEGDQDSFCNLYIHSCLNEYPIFRPVQIPGLLRKHVFLFPIHKMADFVF